MAPPNSSGSSRGDTPPPVTPHAPLFIIAGRYEVLSILGQGGMGAVYLARETNLPHMVAIKTILPHLAARREASERFIREAQALAHPRSYRNDDPRRLID